MKEAWVLMVYIGCFWRWKSHSPEEWNHQLPSAPRQRVQVLPRGSFGEHFVRFVFWGINSPQNSYDSAEPCDRHQECSGISLNDLTNQVFFSLLPVFARPANSASQTRPPVAARALASKTSDPRGPGGGGYTVTGDKPEKTQEVWVCFRYFALFFGKIVWNKSVSTNLPKFSQSFKIYIKNHLKNLKEF